MPSSAPESFCLPSPVTAAAFATSGQLAVASEDGTLRVYERPYVKVWKAVKSLGAEISSVVFALSTEPLSIWVACGQHVLNFNFTPTVMILARKDAVLEVRVTDEDDNELNEISLNGSHLAYTLDSGSVGVIDLKSRQKMLMKTSHTNLCTNITFIPDRPREFVSGGYDSALRHFDYHLGSLLSSLQIGPSEPSAQVSLSPPFVLSISIAQTGIVACGLADGRVWIGSGGEKAYLSDGHSNTRKKKRRKWEGLRLDSGSYVEVAEGPVVGVAFFSPMRLCTLTLLGTLTLHKIESGQIQKQIWTTESPGLAKANILTISRTHIMIGGIHEDDKGMFLIWPSSICEDLSGSNL